MLSFAWPFILLALPLPLLVYFLAPRAINKEPALKVPFITRFNSGDSNSISAGVNSKFVALILLSLAWILLVVSAARPQQSGDAVALPANGRDLMVAVDISGSMAQEDMVYENQNIARLIVVKYILGQFLEQRSGDRVGLILFGTNAYLQAPLTFDLKTVNQYLQEATLRLAGEKTAIGDALGLAVKRLKDRPAEQRILILLTDGENTAGNIEPRQAADLAQQAGVKIYTIGIGAESMEVDRGFFSRTINPSSELDEDTLTYIAESTGGQYFRARNPKELQGIYELLNQMEPIEQEDEFFRPVRSLYFYPLGLSFILFLLSLLMPFIKHQRSIK